MILSVRQFLTRTGTGPAFVRSAVGSIGLRLAGMLFSFVVGVQLARGLGAEGYGIYGLAMTVIALLTVVAEFGLPWLLIRETATSQVETDWGKFRGILRWATRLSVINSAWVIALVVLWFVIADRDSGSFLERTLLTGMALIPLVVLANLLGACLRGLQYVVLGQLPEVLARPALHCALLLFFAAFAVPLTPEIAIALGVFSAAIVLAISWLMFQKLMPVAARHAIPATQAKRWRASAIPIALAEGVRVLHGHLVILFLGALSTIAMVGIFRVASSMSLLVGVPVTLMNVIGAPIISRLHSQGNRAQLQQVLTWIAAGMSLGTLVLTIPFFLWGEVLLEYLFGEHFRTAASPLLIICVGNLTISFMGSSAILLTMTGHEKRVTRALLIGLACLAVAAGPLVHFFGVNGGALATSISLILLNAILWLDAYRLLGMDTSLLSLFVSHRQVKDESC